MTAQLKKGDLIEWAGDIDDERSGQLGIVTSVEDEPVSYLNNIFVQWHGGIRHWEMPSNLKLLAKA